MNLWIETVGLPRPEIVCGYDNQAMHQHTVGVTVEVCLESSSCYKPRCSISCYKIKADRWQCPNCQRSVFTNFGMDALVIAHEDGYDLVTATERIYI